MSPWVVGYIAGTLKETAPMVEFHDFSIAWWLLVVLAALAVLVGRWGASRGRRR